ncbi:MAG: metal-dependent transcriptional regulator [Clostridia bacterium]|nr:metal-dependent transcriptional regulator [Clostridia bacterium]
MSMHESGEMYLETILILSEKLPNVRSIDIGDHMGYSKPSVSRAVGLLKKEGMIRMDSSGYITLTEAGEEKAKRIYERHTLLTQLLINLGVDEQTAAYDACRVEHYISDTTFDAIKAHVKKYGSKN